VLQDEMLTTGFVRKGRRQYAPLGVQKHVPGTLSAEQRAAVVKVLSSRDQVTGISGGASTGKTTALKAIVAGVEQGGKKVYAFAPSAQASRKVLQEEGFGNADTLESLFRNEKLQAAVNGQVLLVDEAGMIGTKDMGKLFQIAQAQNARVILSGDYRQHGSVRAGDAFRLLEKEAGLQVARLKEIRRQTDKDYKAAVHAISPSSSRKRSKPS